MVIFGNGAQHVFISLDLKSDKNTFKCFPDIFKS